MRATTRRRVGVMGALALSFLAAACTEAVKPPAVFSVAFPSPFDSVIFGRTFQLAVQVRDQNGNLLTGRAVQWTSDSPTTAEVNSSGLVTTKSTGGAVMRALVEGKGDQMGLKVLQPVTQVVVTPALSDLTLGGSRGLQVTVTGSSGQAIGGRAVTWRSSAPSIATVNAQGVVSAVALGNVTITATTDLDNISGTATVRVTNPVVSVRLTPSLPQIIRLGGTVQIVAQPLDANNQPLSSPVTWTSVNPSVASVSSSGLVTGLSLGAATIVAEAEQRQNSITVQVVPVPVAKVEMTPSDTVNLFTGNVQQFSFVAKDSAGNVLPLGGRSIVWSSNNLPIVTVSAAGVVQAVSPGVGLVSVTVDGIKSNETAVKVKLVPVASVTVTPNGANVRVTFTLQMSTILRDALGNVLGNRPVTWSVSDMTLATINSAGLLTGVAVGTVTVTAISEGITGTATITVVP